MRQVSVISKLFVDLQLVLPVHSAAAERPAAPPASPPHSGSSGTGDRRSAELPKVRRRLFLRLPASRVASRGESPETAAARAGPIEHLGTPPRASRDSAVPAPPARPILPRIAASRPRLASSANQGIELTHGEAPQAETCIRERGRLDRIGNEPPPSSPSSPEKPSRCPGARRGTNFPSPSLGCKLGGSTFRRRDQSPIRREAWLASGATQVFRRSPLLVADVHRRGRLATCHIWLRSDWRRSLASSASAGSPSPTRLRLHTQG